MAKKKTEETLNIDNILLRKARNSGSFFEKRDMMLTLKQKMMKISIFQFLIMEIIIL